MLWLFALAAIGACQPDGARPKAIFIIVDGVAADVLEATATPHMDEISRAGGYARSFVGGMKGQESESPTVSAVGYMSLLTGTWADKHNVWDNDVAQPNYDYWDIFRIAKVHDPTLQTAIFSTWLDNRTKLLGDGLAAAGGRKLDYHFDGFEHDTDRFPHDAEGSYIRTIDEFVADEAARYIAAQGPDLSWVYLQHTDDVAHAYGDSREQTEAVRMMDDLVGRIWEAVKKRQQDYDEDWLILVTTDHGRDAITGRDHGGQSDRERATWIVTNSTRLNENFRSQPAIVDILPSLAAHLGIEVPAQVRMRLDGKSFID